MCIDACWNIIRAMQKITAARSFAEEKQKWLALILEHLVQHLTIGEEDFDLIPIFTNRGGLGEARKVFGEQPPALVEELNYSIAA